MAIAVATVPLAGEARLSSSKLAADFATWDDVISSPEIEKSDGALTFDHGDHWVAIGIMPAPIPGTMEDPSLGSWLWPDAATDLARQKGHLIVSAGSSTEDASEVEVRKVLSQVVASVLATTEGALGVCWGISGQLVRRDLFIDLAREFLPAQTPLVLWVNFSVGPVDHDSGLSFGFTSGMHEIGLMDLVTSNASEPPGELRQRLINIAEYLLANGLVIENGHTVGESAEEHIRVVYSPSPFGHEQQVMQLDYTTKTKKKGWFGRG